MILVALVLKQDLQWDVLSDEFYEYVLLVSFIVCVPGAFIVAVFSKLRFVMKALSAVSDSSDPIEKRRLAFKLHTLGLGDAEDKAELKRYVEGWNVTKQSACFLSHSKKEAAAEARIMKLELVRAMRCEDTAVFLDSDNLLDLRELKSHVVNSDCVVLLLTETVLSRPWCLAELAIAAEHQVPVIVVRVINASAVTDPSSIKRTFNDLPQYLNRVNPSGIKTLEEEGFNVETIGSIIVTHLESTRSRDIGTLEFDPNLSSVIMAAQIVELTTEMVETFCPENQPLLQDVSAAKSTPWVVQRKLAVLVVHGESNGPMAAELSLQIKLWLCARCNLPAAAVELTSESTKRDTNTASASDLDTAAEHADIVLLVQTPEILKEARLLAMLFAATAGSVPVVPVCLLSADPEHQQSVGYDFARAKHALDHLDEHLDSAASTALANATGESAREVGLRLGRVIPLVITKPLAADSLGPRFEAQMQDIEATLRDTLANSARHQGAQMMEPLASDLAPAEGKATRLIPYT